MKAYTLSSVLSYLHYHNKILASARKQRTKKALKLIRYALGEPNFQRKYENYDKTLTVLIYPK